MERVNQLAAENHIPIATVTEIRFQLALHDCDLTAAIDDDYIGGTDFGNAGSLHMGLRPSPKFHGESPFSSSSLEYLVVSGVCQCGEFFFRINKGPSLPEHIRAAARAVAEAGRRLQVPRVQG